MRIRVMPFLSKHGNQVGKGAIEFDSGILNGFQLVGFTICESDKGLSVMFPAAAGKVGADGKSHPYFFLRPNDPMLLDNLENAILDIYESMTAGFNTPRVVSEVVTTGK